MNFAAVICLPKMVAGLFSHPKRQFCRPKIIGIHFTFITKIPGDNLLKKMSPELPSTEQIFTETSRLVPLNILLAKCKCCIVVVAGWPFVAVVVLGRTYYMGNMAE